MKKKTSIVSNTSYHNCQYTAIVSSCECCGNSAVLSMHTGLPERYEDRYGYLRPVIRETVFKY